MPERLPSSRVITGLKRKCITKKLADWVILEKDSVVLRNRQRSE